MKHYLLLVLQSITSKLNNSLLLIALIGVLTVAACSDGTKETVKLLERIDSLQSENARKDGDLKNLDNFVSTLAECLDSISAQEDILFYSNKGKEGTVTDRQQLKNNLDMFAEMLEKQKKRLALLTDSLKARGIKYRNLESLVDNLNQQIDEKNALIQSLRHELEGKNIDITNLRSKVKDLTDKNDKLTHKVGVQSQALSVQDEIINECYVKIGTKKELQKLGIISGGFLRKSKVNASAFQQDNFMKVDIRVFTEIPLNSANPKILTQMPTSSYRIEKNGSHNSTLYILDPTLFWSVSNYLIVQL